MSIKMKKQKEKYERPLMERTLVELEDSFMAASGDDMKNKTKVKANSHSKGSDFSISDSDTNTDTWE